MISIVRGLLLLVFLSVPVYVGLKNFAFLEPYLFPLHMAQAGMTGAGPRLYGPYPDQKTMAALKLRGYRRVVSLLDPGLVYERSLLDQEHRDALALGLQFSNFPMSSDEPADTPRNAAAIAAVRALLNAAPDEHIYIHCYLGKHRSRTVLAALETSR